MFNRRALLAGITTPALIRTVPAVAQSDESALSVVLRHLPSASVPSDDVQVQLLAYTDMSRYLAAEGFESWSELLGPDGGNVLDLARIPVDDLIHQHIEVPWSHLIGFGPDDVAQAANAFSPPDQIRVYRGSFDVDRIALALGAIDYTVVEQDDFVVFTNPNGEELDLTDPVQQVALGALNYIAVTEDVIICTRTPDSLALVLQSTDNSMYELVTDASLFEGLQPMTGFYLFDGDAISAAYLGLTPEPEAAVLPPADYFAAGVEISETGTQTQLLIDFGDEPIDDAVEIIRDRVDSGVSSRTNQPNVEVIGDVTVELLPNSSVVAISGASPEFARRWQSMIFGLDLNFIATG